MRPTRNPKLSWRRRKSKPLCQQLQASRRRAPRKSARANRRFTTTVWNATVAATPGNSASVSKQGEMMVKIARLVAALTAICAQHAVAENGVTKDAILLGQSVA